MAASHGRPDPGGASIAIASPVQRPATIAAPVAAMSGGPVGDVKRRAATDLRAAVPATGAVVSVAPLRFGPA